MDILTLKDYQVIIGEEEIWTPIRNVLHKGEPYSAILILVDENTEQNCLPKLLDNIDCPKAKIVRVPSGEANKNINVCNSIWSQLLEQETDRRALLINLGGGVVGDMGGFAAATYKRGIEFIQFPTSLLAMVDASIGGKLAIDFKQMKNTIGLFLNPQAVFIYPPFLETLPERELRSGYAEIIKHALIADNGMWQGVQQIKALHSVKWTQLVHRSLAVKKKIVEQDPLEKGMRKVLNFGHTIGHALESYSHMTNQPLLHGEAIAIGMICESFLSNKTFTLTTNAVQRITEYILKIYGKVDIDNWPFDKLLQFMMQDKKNEFGRINFSLLREEGVAVFNQNCDTGLIKESLLYYRGL